LGRKELVRTTSRSRRNATDNEEAVSGEAVAVIASNGGLPSSGKAAGIER
jgi:hypothetical protein